MLSDPRFWMGAIFGVVALWAYHRWGPGQTSQ